MGAGIAAKEERIRGGGAKRGGGDVCHVFMFLAIDRPINQLTNKSMYEPNKQ